MQKLVIKALSERRKILLMRKEQTRVKDSVWAELLSVLDEWHLTEYFTFNYSEYRAKCILNGSQFLCKGLSDDNQKIKGIVGVSDVLLEEANTFTQADFENIDSSIRSKNYKSPLQIFLAFNPVSKQNWVYKYWFEGNPPEDVVFHHSTWRDNRFLDESFIKLMEGLKERDYTRWLIESEGKFATLDQLIYTNWEIQDFNPDEIEGELICGLDFGYTHDQTAFVPLIISDKNKTIHIFQAFAEVGLTNKMIAERVKGLGFAKSDIVADSAEPKSIDYLREEGLTRIRGSIKGKGTVLSGINKVKEYKMIVHSDCECVIIALENYSWKKDRSTGEYMNEPNHDYSHVPDAIRYGVTGRRNNKIGTLSKGLLGI